MIIKNKTILVLQLRLEEWILNRCLESKLKPEDYYLWVNAKRLKDEINSKLANFENLLHALKEHKDSGIHYLIALCSNV